MSEALVRRKRKHRRRSPCNQRLASILISSPLALRRAPRPRILLLGRGRARLTDRRSDRFAPIRTAAQRHLATVKTSHPGKVHFALEDGESVLPADGTRCEHCVSSAGTSGPLPEARSRVAPVQLGQPTWTHSRSTSQRRITPHKSLVPHMRCVGCAATRLSSANVRPR